MLGPAHSRSVFTRSSSSSSHSGRPKICQKCVGGRGSLQRSPRPLAGFKGPTSKGRAVQRREGSTGERRGRERRGVRGKGGGEGKGSKEGKGHTGISFSPLRALALSKAGPSVAEWRGGMSASCKLRVQLLADAGNGWPHSALLYH